MSASVTKLAQALYQSSLGKSQKELDALIDNFVALLRSQRQLSKGQQVLGKLGEVRLQHEGKVKVIVRSKYKLSSSQLKAIKKYCQERTNKEPEVEELIDENIIGGLKLKYQDTEMDITINKKLKVLQNHLLTN